MVGFAKVCKSIALRRLARQSWQRGGNASIIAHLLRFDRLWLRSGRRPWGCVGRASKSYFFNVCSYLALRRNLGTES